MINNITSVPAPWTAVRATELKEGCAVQVWGRTYKTENNLLFSSVTSLDDELLSSPMRISASENGKPIVWGDIDSFLGECTPDKAVVYSTAQSEAFIVNVVTTIEFDGCASVDIRLMPRGFTVPQLFGLEKKDPPKTKLDYFHVEIPIKKEFAKLYHHFPSNTMPSSTGDTTGVKIYGGSGIRPECNADLKFSAVSFFGNDKKGFFTYAESDADWQCEDKSKAMQLISNDDELVLRLRLIDGQPKQWACIENEHGQYEYPDLSFRLGFQATPVKPFPDNPYKEKQLHIDCFKKIPQEYIDFLANPVVEGSDEIGYDRIKRLGVTTLILHEKWNQIQNYWKLTERTRHQLETIISECHKRGIKVVTYFGYEISSLADIWNDKSELYSRKGREMNGGLGWYRFPAQREKPVCYNSPIADEFVDGVVKLADKFDFDGVYLDGTGMVWNCQNTAHGCGYYDDDGKLCSTFPIFAVRRMLKRLYTELEARGKTINCHVSDCICPAAISFAHSLWLGEYIQYSLVKLGADEMPEGYLRATHSGRNFGIPSEFIVYENKPVWTFDDAFAFSLIHGVLPRPNDIGEPLEKISEIWKILDDFPVEQSHWYPYFEGKHPFSCDNENVKISGYRYEKNGKISWLLFVANSKAAEQGSVVVSGFDGCADVFDTESGSMLEAANGKITLDFGKFKHYILRVEE